MCAPLVSSVRRPQQRDRAEGERAAKQERREERARRVDGIGIGMGCGLGQSPWSACRVSPSSHAQALSRRRRRCICSCDLDACLPCCCLLLPTFICAVVLHARETSYTGAQCTSRLHTAQIRSPSPSPSSSPCCCCVSHAAISGFHSIRQRGKVKPSATCHRPPTPLYSRASLP